MIEQNINYIAMLKEKSKDIAAKLSKEEIKKNHFIDSNKMTTVNYTKCLIILNMKHKTCLDTSREQHKEINK